MDKMDLAEKTEVLSHLFLLAVWLTFWVHVVAGPSCFQQKLFIAPRGETLQTKHPAVKGRSTNRAGKYKMDQQRPMGPGKHSTRTDFQSKTGRQNKT